MKYDEVSHYIYKHAPFLFYPIPTKNNKYYKEDIQNVVGDFLLVLEFTLTYFTIFQIRIIWSIKGIILPSHWFKI